ncbi:hypothetical protein K0M31_016110 [Melipona bicolor]|uniref:Uncharacterized protein n=1 Tax=Melipona bicolor TaxID=60889 RepID=A0AA40KT53_9HYME|nr:hypothetical protein K0M31_016110 [Melipona bicolor]
MAKFEIKLKSQMECHKGQWITINHENGYSQNPWPNFGRKIYLESIPKKSQNRVLQNNEHHKSYRFRKLGSRISSLARITTEAYSTNPITANLCEANLPPLEIKKKQLVYLTQHQNTQHRQILLMT